MPVATVEVKGRHAQAGTQARLISQYGCVRIQWDSAALSEVLAGLQREREQYGRGISANKGESISNALLDQAEKIKADATRYIPKRK